MALDLIKMNYNPDVLSCLANLSNDEVFTPPEVVNQMLDMLPQELFCNPDTTFLDPATKSGVFLREIAKRLMRGLEKQIPDLQERVDHIFQKQLFGIAMTELTSILTRRSLYCSKYPNSNFSVTEFNSPEGNIRIRRTSHVWLVREKYQSLIIDFDGLETPQIQTVRTEIMNSVDLINRKYTGTDPRSYRKAQKALKEDEEQYFAPGEADRLLPHDQNSH